MSEEKQDGVAINARALIVATGLWPRRKLRRIKLPLQTPNGPVDGDGTVMLSGEYQEFKFRGVPFRARMSLPPVLLLNKPDTAVTSRRSDAGATTVFEIIDERLVDDVEPVGRLDLETTGVLLFTSDGQLLHRLTHPRWEVARRYVATTEEPLHDDGIASLLAGEVELRDGYNPTPRSIELKNAERTEVELVLTSGKYHEVRRMLAAVGAPVARLHRAEYAGVLDSATPLGTSIRLDDTEIARLYALVSMEPPRNFLEVEVLDG